MEKMLRKSKKRSGKSYLKKPKSLTKRKMSSLTTPHCINKTR
jgi:hypothetical protein